MAWFSNFLESMTFASNNNKSNNKIVHFVILNKTEKPVCVKLFCEDPNEICEDDELDDYDWDDDNSGAFNGCDAIKVVDLMPNQQMIHVRNCMCMDCHIGTILLDTLDNVYYFDADKGSSMSKFRFCSNPEGRDSMDSSALVTSIKESSPAGRRSTTAGGASSGAISLQEEDDGPEEEEVVNVQIEDDDEEDDGEKGKDQHRKSVVLPKRIVTLTIETRPKQPDSREKWLSQGTLEASVAHLEQSFSAMMSSDPTRSGPYTSSASIRLSATTNEIVAPVVPPVMKSTAAATSLLTNEKLLLGGQPPAGPKSILEMYS